MLVTDLFAALHGAGSRELPSSVGHRGGEVDSRVNECEWSSDREWRRQGNDGHREFILFFVVSFSNLAIQ